MFKSINFLRILDKILFLVLLFLFPIRFLFFRRKKVFPKKVLVIRLWGLGDAINVLPIVKTLSDKGYLVDVLVTKQVEYVFRDQDFVSEVYLFNYRNPFNFFSLLWDLNHSDYEVIIDTEQFMNMSTIFVALTKARIKIGYDHKFRSYFYNKKVKYYEKKHFLLNFFNLLLPLKIKEEEKKLIPIQTRLSSKSKLKVDKIIAKFKDFFLIGINIGSGGTALGRRWDENNFAKLENLLSKDPSVKVFFTGTNIEQTIYDRIKNKLSPKHISLINKFSLQEFIYFLSKINLFISNDTGPMHLAAAMGIKTIGLFGLNSPNKVGAWPLETNINLYKNPNNYPIINNKYSIYPDAKYSTINFISVEEVYEKVREMI